MSNDKPPDPNRQLSLFDFALHKDRRPAVEQVADEYGFILAYQDVDGQRYYAVNDWICGIAEVSSRQASNLLANLKRLDSLQLMTSSQQLTYATADGKKYRATFGTSRLLYEISQTLRATEDRPQLKAIRTFLAQSGEFVDAIRADDEAREALAAVKRKREIEKYDRAGLGDRAEVLRLKDRDTNIAVFNSLKETIKRICEHPKWGQIINAEYVAMFGMIAEDLKAILEVKNPRDGLPSLQLAWLTAAERTLQAALTRSGAMDNDQIVNLIERLVKPIGSNLREICEQLGIHPITGKPLLQDDARR